MKKVFSIMAVLFICISISSCSLKDMASLAGGIFGTNAESDERVPETDNMPEKKEEAAVSNNITLGVVALDEFNPLTTTSSTVSDVCSFIFESLYTVDGSMKPIARLAESSTLSADGLTYTVKLKQNITWHDGKSFTAENVVSAIKWICENPCNYSRYTALIASCKATESNTLEIKFKRPVAEPDALMTFPIVRMARKGSSEESYSVPIGTGPFKMVTDKKSDKYRLEAYEEYHVGRASLDAVNIITVDSVDKFRTLFSANEIDLATSDIIDMTSYMPRANAQINDTISNRMVYIGLNTEDKALSDSKTRRAVSFMTDRDELVTRCLHGRGEAAEYALNPSSWLYFDTRTRFRSDDSEAEILLEEAGWRHDTNDSLYNTFNGKMMLYFTPEILVNSESEERVKIAEYMSEKLNAFGIRASVKKVDYETYQSRISGGNYDIYIGETELLPNCDIADMAISGGNYFNFADSDTDLLLTQMGTVTSEEEKMAVAIKLYQKIQEETPFIPICFKKKSLITGSKIKQYSKPCAAQLINNTESWGVM